MGTVPNRKQDREEPQVTNKNNLDRLGTVSNRKHTYKQELIEYFQKKLKNRQIKIAQQWIIFKF